MQATKAYIPLCNPQLTQKQRKAVEYLSEKCYHMCINQNGKDGSIMNVPERIQELRKSKGISQEELANELGISRQAVSKWESGQSSPELDNIVALSEYFGVSADHILKGTPQPAETPPPAPPEQRKSLNDLLKLYVERKNAENESEEKEVLFQLAITQKQKSVLATALFACSAAVSVLGAFILGASFNSCNSDAWIVSLYVMLIGYAMYHVGKRLSEKEAPFIAKYISRASFVFAMVFLAAIHSVCESMDYFYEERTPFAIVYILAATIVYGIIMLARRIKKLQTKASPNDDSI